MTSDYVESVDVLAAGHRRLVLVDGRKIIRFDIDSTIYTIDYSFPHNGASLTNSQLDGTLLRWPLTRLALRPDHRPHGGTRRTGRGEDIQRGPVIRSLNTQPKEQFGISYLSA